MSTCKECGYEMGLYSEDEFCPACVFKDEEYVTVEVTLKKSTYDGLKKFEEVYCVELEDMLSIEADKLLEFFEKRK